MSDTQTDMITYGVRVRILDTPTTEGPGLTWIDVTARDAVAARADAARQLHDALGPRAWGILCVIKLAG